MLLHRLPRHRVGVALQKGRRTRGGVSVLDDTVAVVSLTVLYPGNMYERGCSTLKNKLLVSTAAPNNGALMPL